MTSVVGKYFLATRLINWTTLELRTFVNQGTIKKTKRQATEWDSLAMDSYPEYILKIPASQ